jgi:hypothetical protein
LELDAQQGTSKLDFFAAAQLLVIAVYVTYIANTVKCPGCCLIGVLVMWPGATHPEMANVIKVVHYGWHHPHSESLPEAGCLTRYWKKELYIVLLQCNCPSPSSGGVTSCYLLCH